MTEPLLAHTHLSNSAVATASRLRSQGRAYLAAFVGGGLVCLVLFYGALIVLEAHDRLPSPPVSGTWCIDNRFAWLKRTPEWREAGFIAVGSSTTWRNLDFAVAPAEVTRQGIINAAPCFLTINQTRYMTEYLLERAPATKTVLTVLTMRDLEGCSRNQTAFFDPHVADQYTAGNGYDWWLYFRNFRFRDIFLHALYADERRPEMQYDRFGSGPITRVVAAVGHPADPDPGCYAELTRLGTMLQAKRIQFIAVIFPVMRAWAERYDDTGSQRASFRARVKGAIASTNAILVDGMADWPAPNSAFTDPLHLQWPEAAAFTRFVWRSARQRGADLPPLQNDNALRVTPEVDPKAAVLPISSGLAPFEEHLWSGGGTRTNISVVSRRRNGRQLNRGSKMLPDGEIKKISPMQDDIIQNTPGHSEGYPAGVPATYRWCRGSYTPPKNGPPPCFSAVTAWGQVYQKAGGPAYSNPNARVELANAKTFVHLKATGEWVLVQNQAANQIAGGHFVSDFSRNRALSMTVTTNTDGNASFAAPPSGYNDHFWPTGRGTFKAGDVDAVYVQMDMRVTDPNLIANVGADWWRDASAPYVADFSNNPGAGMSNSVELTTEWRTLAFSSSSFVFQAPPPLAARKATGIMRHAVEMPEVARIRRTARDGIPIAERHLNPACGGRQGLHHRQCALVTVTAVRQRRVASLREKDTPEGQFINGGFFVVEPQALDLIDDDAPGWEREPLARWIEQDQLAAYRHYGYWQNLDTLRDKMCLQELWDRGDPPLRVWHRQPTGIPT
jgi:hypothetical protein